MSRMDKLNQMFKREIGKILIMGELRDPRVMGVTITYADISKDLSWAHVGYSVLSDDPLQIKAVGQGLNSAAGHIRKLLGERVEIRYLPAIKFVYDDTIVESIRMSQIFNDIEKARASRPEAEGEEGKDHE
ncbi:MAG: 30S ribosome-binding factor RbfA [Candidatus Omnitrophica bacterium]|nr:30S ribosome-binding factor RbfA [Candidatus Omnitrophota bacterium]